MTAEPDSYSSVDCGKELKRGDEQPISCVILGGGGHARVLLDILTDIRSASLYAVLDADASRWGSSLLGVPILGGDVLLETLRDRGFSHFVVGIGSIKTTQRKQLLFESGLLNGLLPLTVVHPTAFASKHAQLGAGAQLLANCVVSIGAVLGSNVLINSGAIVEHDCIVGDHVHVATGARLTGGVKVGMGAHIGAGAIVLQGISVGAGATVGAGAVVTKNVAPCTTVVGVPACPLPTKHLAQD